MKYHDEPQGSEQWLALRSNFFTASEAAAMMGCHPTKTRTELLAEKYHGRAKDVGSFVEDRVFAPGHAAEAAYRPIAEATIGDDLFPVTGSIEVEGLRLLASFDGLTMDGAVCFEHKIFNQSIADHIEQTGQPPEYHCYQLEQQLLVAGADRALFVTSDGTQDREASCWYTSQPERRAALLAGWHQFAADLANYNPASAEPQKPTGTAPDTLPALRIEVTGMVTASNLAEFKRTALATIRSVNRTLETDQDFADAEAGVKWCADVESRLGAAKQHALSQTASIDQLFKAIDDISAEARTVRLDLEKLVKARKESIRDEIQAQAVQVLTAQVAEENKAIDQRHAVAVPHEARARIATAMKGKKTVASLRNAADTCRAQIAVELVAKISARKAALGVLAEAKAAAPELAGQCHDERDLVDMQPDHLRLLLDNRLAKLRAAEYARQEAERERIRAEERAKAERAAREQVEAERRAEAARQQAEEHARGERETRERMNAWQQSEKSNSRLLAKPDQDDSDMRQIHQANSEAAYVPLVFTGDHQRCELLAEQKRAAAYQEAANTPATTAPATGPMLELGEINDRLAPISITVDGLAKLGFTPAATDKASRLYRAADLPLILDAMVRHIKCVGVDLLQAD